MAFSISNLGGADPTVDHLIDMENRELNKVKGNQTKTLKRSSEKSSNLKVYKQGNAVDDEVDEEDSALLGSYVCLTPKVSQLFFIECCQERVVELYALS